MAARQQKQQTRWTVAGVVAGAMLLAGCANPSPFEKTKSPSPPGETPRTVVDWMEKTRPSDPYAPPPDRGT